MFSGSKTVPFSHPLCPGYMQLLSSVKQDFSFVKAKNHTNPFSSRTKQRHSDGCKGELWLQGDSCTYYIVLETGIRACWSDDIHYA